MCPRGDISGTKLRGYFAARAHYCQQHLVDCPASGGKGEAPGRTIGFDEYRAIDANRPSCLLPSTARF